MFIFYVMNFYVYVSFLSNHAVKWNAFKFSSWHETPCKQANIKLWGSFL